MKSILFIFIIFTNLLFSKEYSVGFSQDTMANDWRAAQVQEVKDAVSNYPFLKLEVKDAKASVAKQIRDIEEFIKQNVDFIITSPKNAKVTSLVLKKAINKGIKVILISRSITSDDYTAFVAPDNYKIAQDAAKFMAKHINYKGTILMLQGVDGASSSLAREKGFDEVIKKYKDIKVIKKRANYLRNDAIKVMEELYKNNTQFDAIYSHSDSMLIGARRVMKRLDKPIVPSIGIDYIKQTRQAIITGEQTASFVYPTSAKEGVELIVDIIKGKKVPKNSTIKTQLVTKENVYIIEPIF